MDLMQIRMRLEVGRLNRFVCFVSRMVRCTSAVLGRHHSQALMEYVNIVVILLLNARCLKMNGSAGEGGDHQLRAFINTL